MNRRLVVIRHAKAGDGLVDHDRPLAPRGLHDAARIGEWLAAHDIAPERAVVSTALRTRQTWAAAAAGLPAPVAVEFDERIYDNSAEDLLDVIHSVAAEVEILVLVGHSPGVQELVIDLDGSHAMSNFGRKARGAFPTSTIAVLDISSEWAQVSGGDGAITAFVRPEDL